MTSNHPKRRDLIRINGFDAYAPEVATSGQGFRPEHFSNLAKLESGSFWFRSRNSLIAWILGKYAGQSIDFLEIGCGMGFVLHGIAQMFPHMKLSGSELFVEGLSFAQSRVPSAHLMQMDARNILFEEMYDVIGAFDILEHIEEDSRVLQEIHKALRPKGICLLTVPQHQWLWSAADEYACHVRRYSEKEIHEKLQCSGFRIIRSTSFVSLLLPAMILARLGRINSNPMTELRLPKVLNAIFEGILSVEHLLIRCGIDFPIGGSRLIVARKT